MVRCRYDDCRYPDCEFTCKKDRDEIILMLQERIKELNEDRRKMFQDITTLMSGLNRLTRGLPQSYMDEYAACAKVCLHGYCDCVNNPEYLRRHHTEYWIEEGMPTECDPNECYYDDEDK